MCFEVSLAFRRRLKSERKGREGKMSTNFEFNVKIFATRTLPFVESQLKVIFMMTNFTVLYGL